MQVRRSAARIDSPPPKYRPRGSVSFGTGVNDELDSLAQTHERAIEAFVLLDTSFEFSEFPPVPMAPEELTQPPIGQPLVDGQARVRIDGDGHFRIDISRDTEFESYSFWESNAWFIEYPTKQEIHIWKRHPDQILVDSLALFNREGEAGFLSDGSVLDLLTETDQPAMDRDGEGAVKVRLTTPRSDRFISFLVSEEDCRISSAGVTHLSTDARSGIPVGEPLGTILFRVLEWKDYEIGALASVAMRVGGSISSGTAGCLVFRRTNATRSTDDGWTELRSDLNGYRVFDHRLRLNYEVGGTDVNYDGTRLRLARPVESLIVPVDLPQLLDGAEPIDQSAVGSHSLRLWASAAGR